jgi:hypothetical protein
MSRILNRPMFRGGGKVSSYGKGIASGLTSKPKRGLVDEPGGYAGEQFVISPEMFREFNETRGSTGSGSTTGQSVVQKAKDKVKSAAGKSKNFLSKLIPQGKNLESRIIKGGKNLYNLLPKEGLLSKGVKQFPKLTKIAKPTGILTAAVSGPSIIGESNRPKTYAALEYMKSMNQSGVFDETAGPGDYEAFTEEFDRLNDVTKYTPIPDERGFFNKYINPMGFVMGLNPEDKTAEEINKIIEGDTKKNNPDDPPPPPPPPGSDDPIPLTMKEQVEKDKALFAELLGEGEARGKDVSDMLLRFAGSGGNTVGEKFQQYIGAEAMAGPSRTEKINQAAASLAINDYIAGKRSKENMEMMIAKTEKNVDYTIQKQEERDAIKGKDFVKAVGMEATAQKKNVGDTNVIATVLYKQTGKAPKIVSDYANKNYGADVDIDVEKLITGLNIVTFKDRKIVIEKDPSGNLREATEYPI